MDYTVISQLIGSLGFPIVVCGYVLVRLNKTVEENTNSTNQMVALMQQVLERLQIHVEEHNNE